MNHFVTLCLLLSCLLPMNRAECRTKRDGIVENGLKRALLRNRQHIDLINYLISERGYKSYLEIGTADGENFKAVIAEHKIGVDPAPANPSILGMTSDAFFGQNREKFDLIFIDGLHLREQVLKDVENAMNCLNSGGIIVMHDCMPNTEEQQSRFSKPGAWNGDVWKAAAYIRMHFDHVHFCVLDMDWGCGLLTPNSTQKLFPALPIEQMDWSFYATNKASLLNVISVEQWLSSF